MQASWELTIFYFILTIAVEAFSWCVLAYCEQTKKKYICVGPIVSVRGFEKEML